MPSAMTTQNPLTHLDASGTAHMVDVADKPVTARMARAEGWVRISPELERAIRENTLAKGSLVEVVRLAGIQAAKRTDELVPLCHTLPLDSVDVQVSLHAGRVRVEATVRVTARTGVEMEALTAASVALLTIYDMAKALDKAMVIGDVRLRAKSGGRSGDWRAAP